MSNTRAPPRTDASSTSPALSSPRPPLRLTSSVVTAEVSSKTARRVAEERMRKILTQSSWLRVRERGSLLHRKRYRKSARLCVDPMKTVVEPRRTRRLGMTRAFAPQMSSRRTAKRCDEVAYTAGPSRLRSGEWVQKGKRPSATLVVFVS